MTAPWRRPLREVNHEPAPPVYRYLVLRLARMVLPLVARRHWAGQEHIPARGGVLVVGNHISNIDPIILGEFLIYSGRWARFLGKADIWRIPVLGWVARKCDQIPVYRNTDRAGESLVHAEQALREGKLVAIYPEGTITGDPDGWPMSGRRGAASLALATGVPVVPVVQVGANEILGGKTIKLSGLFGRRKNVSVQAGEPIDLSRFAGVEATKPVLDEITNLILDRLTLMRAAAVGQEPPAGRYDLRLGYRVDAGERASE